MLGFLPEVIFVAVVAATAWFVAQRPLLDAVFLFFTILFSSLLAMTQFEQIVGWCEQKLFFKTDVFIVCYLWTLTALMIFAYSACLLLIGHSRLIGAVPEFSRRMESFGRWGMGIVSGYLLASFLLTLLHTVPGSRTFGGAFYPESDLRSGPIMKSAPDYQFLSLVDYVSEPRSVLRGDSWSLGRPIASAKLKHGRWASFPMRYAVWRERINYLRTRSLDDDSQVDR